mmetsp:Transcript_50191/g.139062  ORF Transcript_50191/g.139062 Transcript_50191/m.139062 type:complete len:222 (+) Transcript_50191:345-1010(+)
MVVARLGGGGARLADAGEEGAAEADEEEVGVEVDHPLHVVVWRHLAAELRGVIADPAEDEGGDEGGGDEVADGGRLLQADKIDDDGSGHVDDPREGTGHAKRPERGLVRLVAPHRHREDQQQRDGGVELEHDLEEGVREEVGLWQVRRRDEHGKDNRPDGGEDHVPRVAVLEEREGWDAGEEEEEEDHQRRALWREELLELVGAAPPESGRESGRQRELQQ